MGLQTQENNHHQTQQLETLGLLAGGIAHDFNNLLTGIVGQTSLALLLLPPDNSARKYLERALQAAEVAAGLSKQLLDYAGDHDGEVELVHLNALIDQNLNLYNLLFLQAARVQLDLTPQLPPLRIRPIHVQQIVMNLIVNASEAMDDEVDMVVIRTGLSERVVECAEATKAESFVYLQVSDTGCGMSAETVVHIFDPFFSTKLKGHGLGLSTIKGIVESYNGQINVESEVGVGTTFTIYFPLVE